MCVLVHDSDKNKKVKILESFMLLAYEILVSNIDDALETATCSFPSITHISEKILIC